MKDNATNVNIMDMRKYNADYHKDGTLVWKKIGGKIGTSGRKRKKKVYQMIGIDKIELDGTYQIREDILEQSREQYKESGEMIPVYLSFDLKLLQGYEQYVLAKELGLDQIPFERKAMNKKETEEWNKKNSNKKFGNKKYPIKKINGETEFVSLNKHKKYRFCRRVCNEAGLSLLCMKNFRFIVENQDKDRIVGGKNGRSLNSLHKFFHEHVYVNGKFYKKGEQPSRKE